MKSKIGIIGLGVMGSNLAMNMERSGFPVAGFDLDQAKAASLMEKTKSSGLTAVAISIPEFIDLLEKPRRILMMVPAGGAVDSLIASTQPHLEAGDILIDGGNSYFMDTERRSKELADRQLNFIGMGVSGGEEGALWGPSMMPGGQLEAWEAVEPIFTAIAAKADDGQPCVAYIGPRGAGHYVKMVHNGIEYADMQLIAEIYDLLHRGAGLSAKELQAVFAEWNNDELKSYLIEITADILGKMDDETGVPMVDVILDEAQQKGTGKWASQNAFDIGAPIPTINAAVESRILSSLKEQRVTASKVIRGQASQAPGSRQQLVEAARQALYAGKITAYAQGMGALGQASKEYDYGLRLGEIASIWRAGCIIRASLLGDITAAYNRDPGLSNLLLDEQLRTAVESRQSAWRQVVQSAVGMGIPALALSSALAYFDAYRSERLPANLTQAQRDYFGAHTYRRVDKAGVFHTEWTSNQAKEK